MQIDWFTFGAQLVNFLILIGLLRRYLYGPVMDAMDEREHNINARLEEARERREAARQKAEEYEAMQEAFEAERDERWHEVEEAAEERRRALIDEAREEVEHLARAWRESLKQERETFLQTLSERAVEETVALTRRVLRDLANAELEAQALGHFVEHLAHLEGDERGALEDAFAASEGQATVRSAFGLSDDQVDRIREALRDYSPADVNLQVETDDALGIGVAVRVGDRKVAWTLERYLTDLVDRVRERLDAAWKRGPASQKQASASETEPMHEEE
jgi:F-type H+-transporting ATPase subunit b